MGAGGAGAGAGRSCAARAPKKPSSDPASAAAAPALAPSANPAGPPASAPAHAQHSDTELPRNLHQQTYGEKSKTHNYTMFLYFNSIYLLKSEINFLEWSTIIINVPNYYIDHLKIPF